MKTSDDEGMDGVYLVNIGETLGVNKSGET